MQMTFKQNVISNFSGAVWTYDAHAAVQRQAAKRLAEFLPELQAPRILEIGCGTGFMTEQIVRKYRDGAFVITDISTPMVAACEENHAGPDRTFQVMDGEDPNVQGPFDLVISNMAFQWFEEFDKTIENLKNLLSPGGQILFSTLGSKNFQEWVAVLQELNFPNGGMSGQGVKNPLGEDVFQITYDQPLDFLRTLKHIGARASLQKTNLSVPQLRQVLERCGPDITHHIVYAAISKASDKDS